MIKKWLLFKNLAKAKAHSIKAISSFEIFLGQSIQEWTSINQHNLDTDFIWQMLFNSGLTNMLYIKIPDSRLPMS
jgi:hypothetical protein